MPNIHEPQLVNTVGHAAGAIIFGIFLFLLLHDRRGRLRESWRSIAAAALAFLWNVGSLGVIVSATGGSQSDYLIVFSFSALSLLPAVLLDLSLSRVLKPLVRLGYSLSGVAVVMHLASLVRGRDFRQSALVLITVGFGILTTAALIGLVLRKAGDKRGLTSRMFAAMCSAIFAMSFVHFGASHAPHPWSQELALHHAGIPLALFVLLQDDRFILLDAFIRFLLRADVEVAIVLPPIHPVALELLRPTTWGPMIEACERFVNSLAAHYSLPVVGSFDPSVSGCDASQFYDTIHPTDSCITSIMASWAAAASAKLVKQGSQPRPLF